MFLKLDSLSLRSFYLIESNGIINEMNARRLLVQLVAFSPLDHYYENNLSINIFIHTNERNMRPSRKR